MRESLRDALIVATIAILVNLATVSYWAGEVHASLAGIEQRVMRIENTIDRQQGGKP